MSRLGRMLVGVALASFAAGTAVGLAFPVVAAAWGGEASSDPDQVYARNFVRLFDQRYQLNSQQVRDLHAVLLMYHQDKVRIASNSDLEQWPETLQVQLVAAQRRMEDRIRVLLSAEQRQRYENDREVDAEIAPR